MGKLTATQRMEKHYAKMLIELYRRAFEEENNPLYIWQAYQISRQSGVSIPWWILDYFDEVAKGLLSPHKSSERISISIQKALKMNTKGRNSFFKRYLDIMKKISVVSQILNLLEAGETLEDAIYQVSEKTGKKEDTLHKWFYSYRHRWL